MPEGLGFLKFFNTTGLWPSDDNASAEQGESGGFRQIRQAQSPIAHALRFCCPMGAPSNQNSNSAHLDGLEELDDIPLSVHVSDDHREQDARISPLVDRFVAAAEKSEQFDCHSNPVEYDRLKALTYLSSKALILSIRGADFKNLSLSVRCKLEEAISTIDTLRYKLGTSKKEYINIKNLGCALRSKLEASAIKREAPAITVNRGNKSVSFNPKKRVASAIPKGDKSLIVDVRDVRSRVARLICATSKAEVRANVASFEVELAQIFDGFAKAHDDTDYSKNPRAGRALSMVANRETRLVEFCNREKNFS